MRYWWVSQNQTFQYEVPGGYLWSPKANRDQSLNHYYENMREVSSGDLIFSFCDRKIMALGFARGAAYTCPKPIEFGQAGAHWDTIGWRVDAAFQVLKRPMKPRDHIEILKPFLPNRYSPIRPDGTGNQMYLAEISKEFGQALLLLIGEEATPFIANRALIVAYPEDTDEKRVSDYDLLRNWDKVQIEKIESDRELTSTEKEQVIKSRRGHGMFRNRVSEIENCCRVTKVDRPEHLIASHIKPWRVSDNQERLDGENGLFLTPSIDHLFDKGYISFRSNGALLVSPTAHRVTLIKMGIPRNQEYNVGIFTRTQAQYLEYHRDSIFLKARV
jgi:hypothetical protein